MKNLYRYSEANEETRPFADTYNQSMRDDEDEDFAYLHKETQIEELLAGNGTDEDGVDKEEEAVETVDIQEIYEAVREQAREGVRVYSFYVQIYFKHLICVAASF